MSVTRISPEQPPGAPDCSTGWKNKLQTAIASVTPAGVLAERHRKMAEPGSGRE
ncbi:MAG: hypothetical protein BroJett029_13900 [Alphaproteobacteria bacterium]|nr:MAG: hypothetical protein BroJett029_13900 [Alphaproteobacteria bacterium]